jgi:hypothetical protein
LPPVLDSSISSSRAHAPSSTAHHRLHGSFPTVCLAAHISQYSSISVSLASCLDFSTILLLSIIELGWVEVSRVTPHQIGSS